MERDDGDPAPHEVLREFWRLMHRQRLLLQRAFATEDVHPGQAHCLRVLAHRDEITQSELADTMLLSRPTVTRLVQRMERGGLVSRRTDPADQRQTLVVITEAGRVLQLRLAEILAGYTDATLARLPENDRRQLARLLRRWRQLADEALAQQADADGSPDVTDAAHCSPKGSTR